MHEACNHEHQEWHPTPLALAYRVFLIEGNRTEWLDRQVWTHLLV